jgi:hypothetical protein
VRYTVRSAGWTRVVEVAGEHEEAALVALGKLAPAEYGALVGVRLAGETAEHEKFFRTVRLLAKLKSRRGPLP